MAEQARRGAAAALERAGHKRQEHTKLIEPEPDTHPADDLRVSIDIGGLEDAEEGTRDAAAPEAGPEDARPAAPTPRRASGTGTGAIAEHSGSGGSAAEEQKAAWDASHGWDDSDDAAALTQDSYNDAQDSLYDDDESDNEEEADGGGDGDGGLAASAAQEAMYHHAFHHLQSVQSLRHQREQMRTREAHSSSAAAAAAAAAAAVAAAGYESPPDERTSMAMGDLRGRVSVGPGGAVALNLSRFEMQRLV
jgi:dipeptidyl aminopeptidase/acylaminoacyl peptidase